MNNNEIIRRLRFLLDIDDAAIGHCFELGGAILSDDDFIAILSREDTEEFKLCPDEWMTRFLDGLILWRRGPNDSKPNRNPVALDNNVILKKIRIALELQARDLDSIFMLTDAELSPHEISALFRKPGNKHFAPCSDDMLRYFLNGLSLYWRSDDG